MNAQDIEFSTLKSYGEAKARLLKDKIRLLMARKYFKPLNGQVKDQGKLFKGQDL